MEVEVCGGTPQQNTTTKTTNNMEREIGETFKVGSDTYECCAAEGESCNGCDFVNCSGSTENYDLFGYCSAPWRSDEKNVIFRRISHDDTLPELEQIIF